MTIHPALSVPFEELYERLWSCVDAGLVSAKAWDGLELFCYTKQCVYERAWTPSTMVARGLILSPLTNKIVALPFPKFFNLGEQDAPLPEEPFEAYEKVDGSLIVIWHYNGRWRASTKGSFDSEQARWAQKIVDAFDARVLNEDVTYLAEAVYPENRIVVRYDKPELVLLGGYHRVLGHEIHPGMIDALAEFQGMRSAKRYHFESIAEIADRAKTLSANEEGFVIRFEGGHRIKIKGDEYRRIHALISRCTPLAVWESMAAGDDMELMRRELPEEFWQDFDAIVAALEIKLKAIEGGVDFWAERFAGLPDKEVGLRLDEVPVLIRPFIFPYRNNEGDLRVGRTRRKLFMTVRPTANNLPGYEPSRAMHRVMEEAA